MRYNYMFDGVNEALPVLMTALYSDGREFGSRAGLTKELMHVGITLTRPWEREIVLESRKANVAAQIAETMWVLAGRRDIGFLQNYLPRAADFSDDGEVWRAGYGPRLRDFQGVDQLAYVVNTLKANPASRQAVASIWDPTVDTTPGKDIACNNWLSFSSREGALDLHIGIRSNDAMWGWSGINAFEWSVLLEIVAGMTGLEVGSLHFSTTSFHLYQTHWDKAVRIANDYDSADVVDSPAFGGNTMMDTEDLDSLFRLWFECEERIRTGQPCDPRVFPEPMLRSWLQVLQWYWTGDEAHLEPLSGTRLQRACQVGTKPVGETQEPLLRVESVREGSHQPCACGAGVTVGLDYRTELGGISHGVTPCRAVEAEGSVFGSHEHFLAEVNALHAEKHAAYGDSWKRRGEAGILGNIARKVDRIGSGLDTSDETQADTAVDLMVYLAKYRCWLQGWAGGPLDVEKILARVEPKPGPHNFDDDLCLLEDSRNVGYKIEVVDRMLEQSMALAWSLWRG